MTRHITIASLLTGIGLGGFVDGIVLHQLLQAHHMVSSRKPTNTVAGLEANTLADGLFHSATWIITVAGLLLLWRAMRSEPVEAWSTTAFLALLWAGWGMFNALDTINHVAGLHHVYEAADDPALWDAAFFVFAVIQIGTGLLIARNAHQRGAAGRWTPTSGR